MACKFCLLLKGAPLIFPRGPLTDAGMPAVDKGPSGFYVDIGLTSMSTTGPLNRSYTSTKGPLTWSYVGKGPPGQVQKFSLPTKFLWIRPWHCSKCKSQHQSMNIWKSRGPSTEPYRTLLLTGIGSERILFILTTWVRLRDYENSLKSKITGYQYM